MTNYKGRIKELNSKKIMKEKNYILYWMQASQRVHYNHALDYAIEMANTYNKPLIVFFGLTDHFPEANLRHYHFMLEGLLEVKKDLEQLGVQFIIQKISPDLGCFNLSKDACTVITDMGYLKIQKKWRNSLSNKINCKFIQVESDVVVPVELASNKEEYAAYTIRKKINNLKYDYLKPFDEIQLENKSINLELKLNSLKLNTKKDIKKIIDKLNIDKSIKSSDYIKGGYSEAKKLLDFFIENKLENYSLFSNDPTKDNTSQLSSYLHFGQISPIEIALEVDKTNYQSKEDFLEQLIIRRELSINFVYYNENYNKDLKSILPKWAFKTLKEHLNDKRQFIYSLNDFEKANTHDKYWNAAQLELVKTGLMHNYMRMYWGKKVIEWTKNYEDAFKFLIYLNNKYAIDGRDPNSFTGIAWCFGKHDRAWKERKIFGKIRYMNAAGLERKFEIDQYVEKINQLK